MKLFAPVLLALALAASGASAQDTARIRYGDLDLSTAAGVAAFDARSEAAARDYCQRDRNVASYERCVRAFQRAVADRLPAAARADYARIRRVTQN
jgi:UrcA family protein